MCQQNCTDTNASFVCSCERGYQLTSKGNCTGKLKALEFSRGFNILHLCIHHADINECSTNNGRCPQLCQNTNGSYLCLCYSGYTLDIITHSCNGEQNIHTTLIYLWFFNQGYLEPHVGAIWNMCRIDICNIANKLERQQYTNNR